MIEEINNLTPKQKKFLMGYLETGNASEAYRKSYNVSTCKNVTIHRAAHELLNNPKITAILNRIWIQSCDKLDITIESLTQELELARMLAIRNRQYSASISATMAKARLNGLLTDKRNDTDKGFIPDDLTNLTSQEMSEAYRDMLKART